MKLATVAGRLVCMLALAGLAMPPLASAAPRCKKLSGKLILQPAAVERCNSELNVTVNECYTVAIQGTLQGKGLAGVYAQALVDPNVASPVLVPAPDSSAGRLVLTAKSKLTLRDGTLESQEIILIALDSEGRPTDDVVEQALLLAGTGAYKDASGSLIISGNSIGHDAKYDGQICYPQ
jgi:hypothetical protein